MIFRISGRTITTLAAVMLAAATLSGCASLYVDNSLKGAAIDSKNLPAAPHPTQLIFNFQTKGTNNSKATEILGKQVSGIVSGSHLFSEVSSSPVSNGSLLTVTINNIPITSESDAAAKGFATGFTFGLVGSTVSDGYTCIIDYFPTSDGQKISASSQHMIHTTIGAKGAPKDSRHAKNADDAINTMTQEIVTSALNRLAGTDGFK